MTLTQNGTPPLQSGGRAGGLRQQDWQPHERHGQVNAMLSCHHDLFRLRRMDSALADLWLTGPRWQEEPLHLGRLQTPRFAELLVLRSLLPPSNSRSDAAPRR